MLTLPDAILPVLHPFATLFRSPTWLKAQILLVGAILAPGQRTVAAALRSWDSATTATTLATTRCYRAVWSPRQAAILLRCSSIWQGDGPLIFGIDETLERRRGPKIKSLGIYRDAVRSSRSQVVKASGLRWISLMWLGQVPWAGRYWALPFLTVLAPSARYHRQRGRRHKKLTDWARQMVLQLRRWLPQRSLVLVGDGGYAVRPAPLLIVGLGAPGRRPFEPAPPRQPGQNGRAETTAARLKTRRPSRSVLDHRRGSLVLPARWNSPRKRRSGSLGQAARAPALGLGSGPPGRIRHTGSLLTWPWNRRRFWNGLGLRYSRASVETPSGRSAE